MKRLIKYKELQNTNIKVWNKGRRIHIFIGKQYIEIVRCFSTYVYPETKDIFTMFFLFYMKEGFTRWNKR